MTKFLFVLLSFFALIILKNLIGRFILYKRLNEARASTPYHRAEYKRLGKAVGQKRWVSLEEMPLFLLQLAVVAEDSSFSKHYGINWRICLELLARRLSGIKSSRGGSTITQQTIKNLCFSNFNLSIRRKLIEFILAPILERCLSKSKILEYYLNIIEFGEGIFGIEAAAQHYYQVETKNLTFNQAFHLISLLPAPKSFLLGKWVTFWDEHRHQILKNYSRVDMSFLEQEELLQKVLDCRYEYVLIEENYLRKNPCYITDKKIKVKGLMVHSVGCPIEKAQTFIRQWNNPRFDRACVHAFLDINDLIIYQCLPWNHRGWHCGGQGNNTHIGIELCEPSTIRYVNGHQWEDLKPEITQEKVKRSYQKSVSLFAYLCNQYGLNPLEKGVIVSHREGHELGWASDHKDVDHLWEPLGLSVQQFRLDIASKMQKMEEETLVLTLYPKKKREIFIRQLHQFLRSHSSSYNKVRETVKPFLPKKIRDRIRKLRK